MTEGFIMNEFQEQEFITEIRQYISDNLSLSQLSDQELEEKSRGDCSR